ncbi:MAG: gfo/Idh/MocA family oxidoreductase, partial [Caldilineaceae bacterium]|nr:gfo/Idh/MocA family oxidoreductase [Caldilineaceae bacterium]
DAVRDGTAPPVTGAYGRHIMATIFAAEESSRRHEEIAVDVTF